MIIGLVQRPRLDLADALLGETHILARLLHWILGTVAQPDAYLETNDA